MDKYGVYNTHLALKTKLINYIRAQYLGENKLLLKACDKSLYEEGTLFKEPYIEANYAYKIKKNGIENAEIPLEIKKILSDMCSNKLGVFKNPYEHQIRALEEFYQGKDLFVTTGTGSGKTECFMWPMVSSIVKEAADTKGSWNQRGVRALMIYPMNALVSDQLSRLRRMIGDVDGNFQKMFYKNVKDKAARVPQFGMYTGRTPYPGENDKKQNNELAGTLEDSLLNKGELVKQKLIEIGKYPSKYKLEEYIANLRQGKHITHDRDAELISRQEMQQTCPDILITNYSMLEYMLMRPMEQSIWENTKLWLSEDENNKLLVVIDEAHMYRGSSGGEVALLIRRLLHKLEISRNRVRFILTSASVPKDNEKSVKEFACSLTAQKITENSFEMIYGEEEEIRFNSALEVEAKKIFDIDIDEFQQDEGRKIKAIKNFGKIAGFNLNWNFLNFRETQQWLYDELSNFAPMLRIMKKCRGHAVSYEELSKSVFPKDEKTMAQKATQVVLAIAPLAKNKENSVLFPARLHMMFRGLPGIFACSNPHCTEEQHKEDGISIGKIYFGDIKDTCKCGGKVYELVNDRRCGALFLKGYIYQNGSNPNFVWNKIGLQHDEDIKEVHLYIIPDDGFYRKGKEEEVGWLNAVTGKFINNDNFAGKPGFLHVTYNTKPLKAKPDMLTFYTCPKCGKTHTNMSDFMTKGNESFYNLVSEQLYVQPPTIFDKKTVKQFPNAGRKVLLFSDSRQRAAVLAKDLTRAADDEAVRKAIVVAVKKLEGWALGKNKKATMDLLYVTFLKVSYENNLQFFYGDNEKDIKRDMESVKEKFENAKRRNRVLEYDSNSLKFNSTPGLYDEQLLKLMCSSYRSLSDIGLCWIEPCCEDTLIEVEDILDDNNIKMQTDDFKILFSEWANFVMKDSYALGDSIVDEVRENVRPTIYDRFGIESNKGIVPFLKKVLKTRYTQEQIDIIYKCLLRFTEIPSGMENRYLNLNKISLCYDENKKWYHCKKCAGVFPFELWGYCAHCGSERVSEMSKDELSRFDFWRLPVLEAIDGKETSLMTRINTEEHTAQLSHKDQRQKMWSTTENYEMKFQNVNIDDSKPVDILSCTTTMEVGIDIGSLTAVGLRNIPPMRENYQQRAGRAGRRSAAISTIVTFTDNGPHDSYYFNNPAQIISGDVRTPWIDTNNFKILHRHLNMMAITKFLINTNIGIDKVSAVDFFINQLEQFYEFLKNYKMSVEEQNVLVPESLLKSAYSFKKLLVVDLGKIQKKIIEMPTEYKDDKDNEKTLLDVLYDEGVLPTYSFPKNVVGFYIEDKDGKQIDQKPERSLDMAISEYAPGRTLVVNKKTFKCGGIYNFHSKFRKNFFDKPARAYFENSEYYKTLYYCKNTSCGWFSTSIPSDGECPFCKKKDIGLQNMVKPWGFSPKNGKNLPESQAENELSYAENPCYSATPKDSDMKETEYQHIRCAKRSDQTLLVLNKGPKSKGFNICKDCGAAVTGEENFKGVERPYNSKIQRRCSHYDVENMFLGHSFLTDMVVFEFAIDKNKINAELNGLWINTAALTLSEAMVLAAGRMLDVEFNEIRSGYRLRDSFEKLFVDVFLFDSLSSGAGYSSEVADRTTELFQATRSILQDCNCDSSCHLCLNHFWNQRVQAKLDRFRALELLDWGKDSSLPSVLTLKQQLDILKPIKELIDLDNEYHLTTNANKIYVLNKNKKKEIYIYPVMWNKNDKRIPSDAIKLSDRIVKNALPMAYNQFKKSIDF